MTTTTYGVTSPPELDYPEIGSVRIYAERGDHHASIVVPRGVMVAGGGDAVALAVGLLDRMLDELDGDPGHAYRST